MGKLPTLSLSVLPHMISFQYYNMVSLQQKLCVYMLVPWEMPDSLFIELFSLNHLESVHQSVTWEALELEAT